MFQCDIEGYHDPKQRVIYLHLRGVYDVHTIVKTFDLLSKELDEKVTVFFICSCIYSQHYIFLQGLVCPHHMSKISHFKHFCYGF